MYLPLSILASFAFLYSIAARRIDKTPFTGPIIFISFGILVGPHGLALLNLEVTATKMRVWADLTLAMVLLCDAAKKYRGRPCFYVFLKILYKRYPLF